MHKVFSQGFAKHLMVMIKFFVLRERPHIHLPTYSPVQKHTVTPSREIQHYAPRTPNAKVSAAEK